VDGAPGKADVDRCEGTVSQQITMDSTTGTIRAGAMRAAGSAYTPPTLSIAGVQLWAKPLPQNRAAALFINGGGTPYPSVSLSLDKLNVTIAHGISVRVTDVWTGEDAGPIEGGNWETGVVASLDSRFVIFSSA
jgi:hypothetical protein